jgi:hypothetical protein
VLLEGVVAQLRRESAHVLHTSLARLTSATAVMLRAYSSAASASRVRPAAARWRASHASPTCAWLRSVSGRAPSECFEQTTSERASTAAMKMMQPFSLNVATYGGALCAAIASGWAQ